VPPLPGRDIRVPHGAAPDIAPGSPSGPGVGWRTGSSRGWVPTTSATSRPGHLGSVISGPGHLWARSSLGSVISGLGHRVAVTAARR